MLKLSSKQKKIVAGIGIVGGIVGTYLLLKNRLGFGNTPVELWKRGNNNVRDTRKLVAQLQKEAREKARQGRIDAELKQEREESEKRAEWNRRELIWEKNRAAIEAARP